MPLLNGRQRVAAASLLKRRPMMQPEAGVVLEDPAAYNQWYELVYSEMQRLGIFDPDQVREFCERAGVPADQVVPLSIAPATAA